ncbi:Uncharacterised protein [Candidatus Bilamarchaeum dharawalense]|uniref:Glycosyl transferases group 1 n=1 Tax=Candidatus Bilamarchaeum dharawalense TaxID=2885759 RepID=A0A5E4LPF6_9ARCH|nr:Uncharacterised protein [Candidatus Bilamarchaeum dharawalense]
MKKTILVTMIHDTSTFSGPVNKYYATIDSLDNFDVDISATAVNLDPTRLKNPKRIKTTTIKKRFLISDFLLMWEILRNRSSYVYMPLAFSSTFLLLVLAAKAVGSKVILHMGDPLYLTIKNMQTEVKQRVKLGVLVWLVTGLSKYIEWILLDCSDYIFVVSPSMEEDYRKITNNKKFIKTVFNYVPVRPEGKLDQRFEEIRKKFKYIFIYFGQIQSQIRSYEKLIDIFSMIKRSDQCLVFLGPDKTRGNFQKLVAHNRASDRIFHFEPMPKNRALLHLEKTDYHIIGPSPAYAIPNKFFDAYQVKLPMLIPDNLEDVKNIFDGLVITYKSEKDLIQKIEDIENCKITIPQKKIETYAETMERFFSETLGFEKR